MQPSRTRNSHACSPHEDTASTPGQLTHFTSWNKPFSSGSFYEAVNTAPDVTVCLLNKKFESISKEAVVA
jgi:hypothetical protein